MRLLVALLVALGVVLSAGRSHAHAVGASTGEWRVEGDGLRAELVFARAEVDALVPTLLTFVAVTTTAGDCRGTVSEVSPNEEDGRRVRLSFACPAGGDRLTVRLGLLQVLARGHRHFATVVTQTGTGHPVLTAEAPSFEIAVASRAGRISSWSLLRLGVEHILDARDSWDHLLFLLGLVIVSGRARAFAIVVTAFTLAHSVTLGLSALDVWAPSPRLVEPLIALSIAWVGAENFWVTDVARRWRITLPFGLVHGFGFAGRLREIGLPRADVPRALLLFNVGVELGQLVVLAALLPLVMRAAREPWYPRLVRVVSAAVVVVGVALVAWRLTHPS